MRRAAARIASRGAAWAAALLAGLLVPGCAGEGTAMGQVLTAQYDAARTGADTTETKLTPRNLNRRQFGRRWRIPEDGDVFAQPLVAPGVRLADGRAHDRAGTCLRFTTPTVWDGRVYVGTRGGVDVYGLLDEAPASSG